MQSIPHPSTLKSYRACFHENNFRCPSLPSEHGVGTMYHNVGIHQHTEVALLKGSNPVDAQYPIRTARDYSIGTLSLRGFLYLAIKFGWPTVARGLSMMRLVSGFIETISKAGNPIPDPQPVAGGLWRSQRGVLVLVPFR